MPRIAIRGERSIAAAAFALVLIAAFPNVVFFGRSLLPSDNLNPFDYRLLAQNYGPSLLRAKEFQERGLLAYPNFHDIGASIWQAEPGLIFLRDALRDGELPLWDPFTGAGCPALSNLTCAFLFPPQLILAIAGATSTLKNLYVLLIFWTAGFATYVILRQHGIAIAGAFAGGVTFMMSGALQQAGSLLFKGQTIALMPVVLVATRWFLDQPTWKRTAALSLLFAVVAQASFPPMLLAGFGLVTIYVMLTIIAADRSRRLEIGKRFGAAVAMSLGMSAFLYLPAMEALKSSPHSGQFYHDAAQLILSPYTLIQLLSPSVTGGARIYENPAMDDSYHELFYIGAIAVLLAVIGMARGRAAARTLWLACSICSLLTLAKVFGAPPAEWASHVPGFRTVHFAAYFGMFLALLLSLLAGIGLDRLMLGDSTDRAVVTAIAVVTWLLIGAWSLSRNEQAFFKPDYWRWLADLQVVIIFAAAGSILLLLMRTTGSARVRTVAGVAMIAGIFIEGVTNTTFPRQSRFDVFANLPPYVKAMKQMPDTGRFFTSRVLDPNLGSGTAIRQVESIYNFQLTRLFEVYRTYTAPPQAVVWHFLRDASELPPEPVLDRLNVGYVAVRPSAAVSQKIDDTARTRGYPVEWQDAYARIYSRKTLPRALFSSSYQIANRADALRLIGSAPADRVILETRPGFPPASNLRDDPQPRIVHALRNRLTIDVQSPRPGILYLADTWFPGWTATVNGREKPILIANYAFRAVEIPAGPTVVEWTYWPVGMTLGLTISAICLMLCALCLFLREKPRDVADAISVDDALPAV